ncbi:MAG TPA: glycosyltransferase family A protein [Polyangiales bacterium]|nr:glycosyltransferase family A protein [Polyangiales bacterium]
MVRCSVVIRACNEEKHIGRLLDGLFQQTERELDVVLVDSGSSDATVSIASRYPLRVLHIAPDEFTFGRSLNLGLRNTHGAFVVLASAHVYPLRSDWIARLLAPFENPDVALCYGKQRGNEITRYAEHRVFARWFPEQSEAVQTHPFCNNANAAIRRSVWETLPYDETLTGLEDIDWAHRALAAGHKLSYAADAAVAHVHEETASRIYNRYYREAIALKHIFPHEHFGLREFARVLASNLATDCYHALRDAKLVQELPGIVGFRLMQFLGTYRGFAKRTTVTSELKQKFYYPDRRP